MYERQRRIMVMLFLLLWDQRLLMHRTFTTTRKLNFCSINPSTADTVKRQQKLLLFFFLESVPIYQELRTTHCKKSFHDDVNNNNMTRDAVRINPTNK